MKEPIYYALEPPTQWSAGRAGDREIFFDCGDCGAKEPPIAGILATSPTYENIMVLVPKDKDITWARLAMFCETCFRKRLEGNPHTVAVDQDNLAKAMGRVT